MGVSGSKLVSKTSVWFHRGRGISYKRLASSDGGSCSTPKGYVPVLVGLEEGDGVIKRFMVHRKALRDGFLLELLCRSEEEYGFCNEGVLRIPCEAEAFEDLIMVKDIAAGSKHNKVVLRG